ncbi:microsomal signal peptidase 12kDa subunit [Sporodiniella umbellata]|nr:microsomal signal peptidase 12kDa subunit [Sporodiniella umbellata]
MGLAEILECTIDFEGQKKTENLMTVSLVIFGALSFLVGYSTQSLIHLLAVFVSGFVLTALVVLPPWPMYNKNPQPFIQDTKTK